MTAVKEMDYTISHSTDFIDKMYGLTPAINDKITEMYFKVQKKKNSAVKELTELIRKYPRVPQFRNLLSVLYSYQGNYLKTTELHREIAREHPEYLYGKINLAFEYISNRQYEKVPEVLGASLEISELYPHRNEFNYDEVLSYNKAALLYFITTNNEELAEQRFRQMQDIDDESPHTKWAELKMMTYRMSLGIERLKKENAERRTVKAIAAKVTEVTDEKPHFNHAVIEQLYSNSMRIPHTVVAEILALPKDTLLQDLNTIVYDSIARFEYFKDYTIYEYTTHEFLTHALFIMGELHLAEGLQAVLDMLRQDEKYLDYWFGDALSEIAEDCIFSTGLHATDELLKFLKEPDRQTYARSAVSGAVSQIVLHYPERRNEVLEWFNNIFEFFTARKDDERLIDTDLIGLMVWDCLDIEAKELLPVIENLYKENLAATGICGDWTDVQKSFNFPFQKTEDNKKKRRTIYEKYEYVITQWYSYSSKQDIEAEEEIEEEWDDAELQEDENNVFASAGSDYAIKQMPQIRMQPKVSRNAPCPCRSGKKYKRCCGKD